MIESCLEGQEVRNISKICSSFELVNEKLVSYRKNHRIVLCHGVFDLLHIGHIRHFEQARAYGDILVVSITPDLYVNKGPGRPAFNERLRAESVAALEYVDLVIINLWPTAVDTIKQIRPNFYVKGDEYNNIDQDITGGIALEQSAVNMVGGKLVFTSDITFSSSTLINKYFSPYKSELDYFLLQFKNKFSASAIFEYINKAMDLSILVIGEAVMDTYCFMDVIGKAGKEPTLVGKHLSMENYIGGSLAVANHVSDFCKKVTCLTYLGEKKEYEDFIFSGLRSNVKLEAIYKKSSPTIVKRRYLDKYLQQKLFEVYEINDDFLDEEQENLFCNKLSELGKEHDLVIVIDYGHGLLSEKSIDILTKSPFFIAVNTQSNAGNMGFNCISKYTRADYVTLASRELQLNYRQRHLPIEKQIKCLMEDHDYNKILVTYGKQGAYVRYQDDQTIHVPAWVEHVVDRVGAGDAVLAITSLLAYLGAPAELLAFVGNVVGAEAVNIMGNKESIKKVSLMKHISHLLK